MSIFGFHAAPADTGAGPAFARAFIDGDWCAAASGAVFPVNNPATGQVIANVADLGPADIDRAIAASSRSQSAWRELPARERSRLLRRWHDLILDNRDRLAALLTAEQGKPLAEADGEIAYGAAYVEWFAEEAKRVYGDTIPSGGPGHRILVLKEPVGVCAAITPWNFPSAMILRKAGPALAAGCTMLVKPSELTPLSALALAELAVAAGIPAGVFNVVPCAAANAPAVGGVICDSPLVRKISFTGSTEVGRILLRQSAATVKKCSMELGGNAPFIVFDDADLELAVDGALRCKFRNAGQTCVSANRILVHDAIYDRFCTRLVEKVNALKVGDGAQPGVDIGPLIDQDAMEKVTSLVGDGVTKGGRLLTGGAKHAKGGTFYTPTILADVDAGMRLFREEVFGPVAPIVRFRNDEEAIALANDTEYGLAAYFYTSSLARAVRLSERLEYGMVAVNEPALSTETAPFGGIKQSGMGREGSKYGIEDYLEIKYVKLGLGV